MEFRYRIAVLAFCDDLTSPSAGATPVGTLLIGESDTLRLAAAATSSLLPELSAQLDPISRRILGDLTSFLKSQVAQMVQDGDGLPLDELFARVHGALRNSLYVAEVTDIASLEAGSATELGTRATEAAVSALATRLTGASADERGAHPPPSRSAMSGSLPETRSWPLPYHHESSPAPLEACL